MTALVVIALAVALTLVVAGRGYEVKSEPRDELNEASVAMQQCWDPLIPLSGELIPLIDDPDRFAQKLVPLINRCKKAEAAIGIALQRSPDDPTLAKLRKDLGMSQSWLNDLAKAIASYKAARQQGSAAPELTALKALLQ